MTTPDSPPPIAEQRAQMAARMREAAEDWESMGPITTDEAADAEHSALHAFALRILGVA